MINNIVLMGRLTFEPELKVTKTGIAVCSFGLAVDRQYTSGEEKKADFIDCRAWRSTADFICKYFHKGSMLALVGRLQTSNYTDKNGNKRKSVTVIADNVSFCGSKAESGNTNKAIAQQNETQYQTADASDFEEIVDEDDDLPF